MLKHATINRTSKAQQTLQFQRQWSINQQQHQLQAQANSSEGKDVIDGHFSEQFLPPSPTIQSSTFLTQTMDETAPQFTPSTTGTCQEPNNNNPFYPQIMQTPSPLLSCNSSPTPSLLSTPSKLNNNHHNNSHIIRSLPTSPMKSKITSSTAQKKCFSSESTIKVFAQTLSQEVEYVTLHVNTQTKSNQIVKTLLKKFRLKHRDPNLFYLTLERWIRKDGLKFKSVMLLGDEACPLQLQQCCSNPPHNDIKFTLQMRAGALVKIFCSDVAPDARYKCVSLSTHTTVEETIELMLHCLNLAHSNNDTNTCHHVRFSNSPCSTNSSASSNSSSSGVESDQPNSGGHNADLGHHSDPLSHGSRTGSITSISSASNVSNVSTSVVDQYCMIIECKDTNFRRVLESDEYLVDVYQNLLAEAKDQSASSAPTSPQTIEASDESTDQQPEQWFFIKLKRRDDYSNYQTIKFTNPRQNLPLPPIPLSLSQFNNSADLQSIISTAQIEVNHRPGSSSISSHSSEKLKPPAMNHEEMIGIKQAPTKMPPPPRFITLLPPITPRRRNLSNASSTFSNSLTNCSRRRYDPAQLAEDLNKLDLKEADHSTLLLTPSSMTMTDKTPDLTDSPVTAVATPLDPIALASSTEKTLEQQLTQASPDSVLN